jgi:Uma2 family endonuclease
MPLYRRVREEEHGLLLGPCGVVLSADTLVIPDMLFVSRERREILGEAYIEGPPDLVAEIVSMYSATQDRTHRRDLYARHGVRHYWLVEPIEKSVRAYELGADGFYELIAEAHGTDTFVASPFPNLAIQLADLWDAPV